MKASKLLPACLMACVMGMSFGARAEAMDLPVEGEMPSFKGATGWLDAQPLTPAELRGKVVLVDFWTYSCINSIRQLPYLRAWARKYKDQGLVVIGVHSPEFAFEKNPDNVRQALKDLRVGAPIATAIDSDHGVWLDFNNEYWPAIYLVDARGRIRHHVFGEGEYEQTERVIQQLLTEAGARNVDQALVVGDGRGIEAAPDLANLKSPETYVGSERAENFVSKGGRLFSSRSVYAAPDSLSLNHWALVGDWTIGKHSAVLNTVGGRIVYRFHARDLHLVMGPRENGSAVRFRVLIDGKPPGAAHGIDVDAQGNGTLFAQRLYQLIRQAEPITDREFEIEFLDAGAEAFVFTFG
ncbi:redoxin family protein [Dyella halodurans]|uniref:Redoxin family protein n=1 Tax=Dyella halodurans TaxID=1920171 RepID=A0ABV9C764_9GAMM|nr:redoxin family protein [Dyella halodurans]